MSSSAGAVIAINKPKGWTSFQVVNKLKWHLKRTLETKKIKIGHAGTLDPLASGLLLVCVGNATKQIESLQAGIKEYSGTIVLGATTPCFDLEQAIDSFYPYMQITEESLEEARRQFVGPIEQIPPMFSAVKVDGKRAYLSARDGQQVDIAPKKIAIYNFDLTSFQPGRKASTEEEKEFAAIKPDADAVAGRQLYRNPQGIVPAWLPSVDFHVSCSKGTYIRSLARDLGLALDSGAFLSALRRERIGTYTLADTIEVDKIESTLTKEHPLIKPFLEQQ